MDRITIQTDQVVLDTAKEKEKHLPPSNSMILRQDLWDVLLPYILEIPEEDLKNKTFAEHGEALAHKQGIEFVDYREGII